MKIYKNIALIAFFLLGSMGFCVQASAQTLGSGAPINFNQILSGKGSSYSRSSTGVNPYTGTRTGSADYDLGMSPSTVMKNRARRDAMAQAQSRNSSGAVQQSYLDGEYQQAFDKYQEQFRTGGANSSSSTSQSSTPQKVSVKYNGQKKKKLFVTPQRVFKQY
jgi:hypothetical protein